MLSMQHVLCGALAALDDVSFQKQIGALVFPDAIRAYSGPRQYSHFEKSFDDSDVSWWRLPSDMKSVTKESVQESIQNDGHLVRNIPACVIGEDTDINAFYDHNGHLPENMFRGVEMHLRQDMVFDKFVRDQFDCTDRYADKFSFNGVSCDGKELRGLIARMEQEGIYHLAHRLYEEKGITANQEWFCNVVEPALRDVYPDDLADKTFGFMKLDKRYDTYITNHDWSHLDEGLVSYEDYGTMYDEVLSQMSVPSEYQAVKRTQRVLIRKNEMATEIFFFGSHFIWLFYRK